jgi:hypothetical protein
LEERRVDHKKRMCTNVGGGRHVYYLDHDGFTSAFVKTQQIKYVQAALSYSSQETILDSQHPANGMTC